MGYKQIGPIFILTGKNNSHVPYCTSLLINGDNETILIDCGGGQAVFDEINKHYTVDKIYLTHYHLDHIWGAYLFDRAEIFINPYDLKKLTDPFELAKANGVETLYGSQGAEKWVQKQITSKKTLIDKDHPSWGPVIGIAKHSYSYGQPINIAGTTMTVIHTPGHTEGFCCPYFPEYGVLFAGDYDLTSFGPWYNDADSDIDQFIESSQKTLETDAKYFVTAHHKGIFERKAYEVCLYTYIDKIYEREEKVKKAIQQGIRPKDIVYQEVFYFLINHKRNKHLVNSEIIGIAKHIERLIKQGYEFEDYYQDYITYYQIQPDALNYRSEPVK
ncbi:glyoxylase-like metal-dependent hydrolase (beta-lactamase superfamily II) [Scopulibacillus daqui]|uniref:Glyoxylase-like metal-dependent hydrolase (Beta-lactamase superfamily II) n=1 Tax=Scopulibacillus daqui TaxID=1469162 RepID=A0ABS2Q0G4_9BACL|nr:MBL fold metallo-hydrolase [Scopulibacillus daqui]MBM7645621.1 glyoxylase-like metal-dependent hydrolase (beta-lactamase superfamily II) [Scopulibacillus daqui]